MPADQYGDYQTPFELARRALARMPGVPDVVVEPACGKGAFLRAAADRFPSARLIGYERSESYVALAHQVVPDADIRVADAFEVDWEAEASGWRGTVWVVGNPPWVTSAALGRTGGFNKPKAEAGFASGLAALTGDSNYDLAEWFWLRLLSALEGRDATLGMICKTQTARRVLGAGFVDGIWRIDARRDFGVSVDAGWLVGSPGEPAPARVFASLDSTEPEDVWRVHRGTVVGGGSDESLSGESDPAWRSGVKHDCARVFELVWKDGWRNGLGEAVDVERIAPFLKAGDLHRGSGPDRAIVLPVRRLGQSTESLATEAPKTWAYLMDHAEHLDGRKSRVWKTAPRFGLFGIGPYSFAPWKVAVSGLRSELNFRLVGPRDGSPVLVDDTSYFLPFEDEAAATDAFERLSDPRARAFLAARTFGDAKRKITRRALQQLDFRRIEIARVIVGAQEVL